jgi:hypothetical protein
VRARLFDLVIAAVAATVAATDGEHSVDTDAASAGVPDETPDEFGQPPPRLHAIRALTAAPAAPPLALAG